MALASRPVSNADGYAARIAALVSSFGSLTSPSCMPLVADTCQETLRPSISEGERQRLVALLRAGQQAREDSIAAAVDRVRWSIHGGEVHISLAAPRGPQLRDDKVRNEPGLPVKGAFIKRQFAREVKQPADGSCLFHSLCYGLQDGTSARQLRLAIAEFILRNPDLDVAGVPLSAWVEMESGHSVKRHATKMATGDYGGAVEMQVFSVMKQLNVYVYQRCHGGYERTCAFEAGPEARGTVHLLYRKRNHYDALVVDELQLQKLQQTEVVDL